MNPRKFHTFRASSDPFMASCIMTGVFVLASFAVATSFFPSAALFVAAGALVLCVWNAYAEWLKYHRSLLVIDEELGIIEQRGPRPFRVAFAMVRRIEVRRDFGTSAFPHADMSIATHDEEFIVNGLFFGTWPQTRQITDLLRRLFRSVIDMN
jgi:hypothetical protein